MSSISIPRYKCDRCGHAEMIYENDLLYGWGVLFSRQNNGPFSIGNETYLDGKIKGADICSACVSSLNKWWKLENLKQEVTSNTN